MSLSVSAIKHEKYLEVITSGTWDLNDALRYIEKFKLLADKLNYNVLLNDVRTIVGEPSLSDAVLIGEHFAHVFGPTYKIALVNVKEKSAGLVRVIAMSQGMKLIVFFTMEEAVAWLLGDSTPSQLTASHA